MSNPTLHVRIISPQQLILDIEARSVSSKNSRGNFDILAQHTSFITLVENTPITIRSKDQKLLVYKFPVAIILTRENKVDIYTYIQPQEKVKS